MIRICPGGWSQHFSHPPMNVDTRQPVPVPQTPGTHTMCEKCSLITEAEMNGLTGLPLAQYAAYLASPIDPRD